jgi:rhodanese-related sulfurtransferase
MDSIISFLMAHWVLSSLFIVLFVAFIGHEMFSQSLGASMLSPEIAVDWMNHQEAVVIDVRSAPSFLEGHIVGAHNIPGNTLDKKIGTLQKYKDKPLIIVCSMGREAAKVAETLKKQGFRATVLQGGLQGWRAIGLPLAKK